MERTDRIAAATNLSSAVAKATRETTTCPHCGAEIVGE